MTNSEQLHDIRGPVSLNPDLWPWLVGGAALLVLAFWFLVRRMKSARPAPPGLPPRPCWEVALERLNLLERSKLLSEGRFKDYYSMLSDIVRSYIEARFDIRAPEMTTEEFLALSCGFERLKDGDKTFLGELLQASDMVKFAKFVPQMDHARENMGLARKFIEETKPLVEEKKNGI
jgi:hypothetical protein